MDNFDLKKYLAEGKLNEAGDKNLYKTAGEMISQVGLFTQKNAKKLEAYGGGNLGRFFNTPEEKAENAKYWAMDVANQAAGATGEPGSPSEGGGGGFGFWNKPITQPPIFGDNPLDAKQ